MTWQDVGSAADLGSAVSEARLKDMDSQEKLYLLEQEET